MNIFKDIDWLKWDIMRKAKDNLERMEKLAAKLDELLTDKMIRFVGVGIERDSEIPNKYVLCVHISDENVMHLIPTKFRGEKVLVKIVGFAQFAYMA